MKDIKVKMPKCWICKDIGMIFFLKKINHINYEFAARCKCVKGLGSGDRIPVIEDDFGEVIAESNFNKFKDKHPEILEEHAI